MRFLRRKWCLLIVWLTVDIIVICWFGTRSAEFRAAKRNTGRNLTRVFEAQARSCYWRKDHKGAVWFCRWVVNIDRRCLPANDPAVGRAFLDLGRAYSADGEHTMAASAFRSALATDEEAYGRSSASVATDLRWLAYEYTKQGKLALALPRYERVVKIDEHLLGTDRDRTIEDVQRLAHAYQDVGDYRSAEPLYERAARVLKSRGVTDRFRLAGVLNYYASMCMAQEKPEKAVKLYKQALAIEESMQKPNNRYIADDLSGIGYAYNQMRENEKAESVLVRAVQLAEQLPPGSRGSAEAYYSSRLARVYYDENRYAEAETLFRRILALDEKRLSPDDAWLSYDLAGIAKSCYHQKKYAQAEPLLLRALAIQRKCPGTRKRDLLWNLVWLGDVYLGLNKFQQAEQYYKEGLALAAKTIPLDDPHRSKVALRYDRYARVLRKLGKTDEARTVEAHARESRHQTGSR